MMDQNEIFERLCYGIPKGNAPKTEKTDDNKSNEVQENEEINGNAFEELNVHRFLLKGIEKCGYKEPTEIQKQTIPLMLKRRNVFATAPTGSGKTAAFLIPVIQLLNRPKKVGFRAVVVAPTRELSKQIHNECLQLIGDRKIKVHIMLKMEKAIAKFGPQSSMKLDILISTPNRLCLLLKHDPPVISLANVQWLIVDEADKLFEAGTYGFKHQLNDIIKHCTSPDLKMAMFSATSVRPVSNWCQSNMKKLAKICVGERNTAVSSVHQELKFVGWESGKLLEIRALLRTGLKPPILVFVNSKERAQQLFMELIYDDVIVDVIHGDRTQLQRDNTVKAFREGKIWLLICTELLGRGIDFKAVNVVINYDFPHSDIDYIHRVGRAGRAGLTGRAITFFTIDDKPVVRSIAEVIKKSGYDVPEYLLNLKVHKKKAPPICKKSR